MTLAGLLFGLGLLIAGTPSAASQGRADVCALMPPGANELNVSQLQGSGYGGGCGGVYGDYLIHLNVNLLADRALARYLALEATREIYPSGAASRPVAGLGEAAQEGLVGSDADSRWYGLQFVRGCYAIEVWSPRSWSVASPQSGPMPVAEARRLATLVDQRLASEPQCTVEGSAPVVPPAGQAAPAAPTVATAPTAAPSASGTTSWLLDRAPILTSVIAALDEPLTGQVNPAPPDADDVMRGAALGTVALGLTTVLALIDQVIGLGVRRPRRGG